MPPYRAALTSLSRCLFSAQLDSEQSRRISTMGKSLPPKPPDDSPTVSIERALIVSRMAAELAARRGERFAGQNRARATRNR